MVAAHLGEEPGAFGEDGRLHAVDPPELGQQGTDVVLRGAGRDVHAMGDLGVGQAAAQEGQRFALSRGESGHGRAGLGVRGHVGEVAVDDDGGDPRSQRPLTRSQSTHLADQVLRVDVLEEVPGRPAAQRGTDLVVAAEGRQHRDDRLPRQLAQLTQDRNPVHVGHPDVQQDDIGAAPGHGGQRVCAAARGHHLQVTGGGEGRLKSRPHQPVVVHDGHPQPPAMSRPTLSVIWSPPPGMPVCINLRICRKDRIIRSYNAQHVRTPRGQPPVPAGPRPARGEHQR